MSSPTVELRAPGGRGLTIATGLLCATALVTTAVQQPGSVLRWAPALLVPLVLVWAVLGRPAVVVSDGGIELRNVLRTVHLPWPSVERVETRYALTLHTAYGCYVAWAAPAPGRARTLSAGPGDLPTRGTAPDGVRPGDLVTTPSGRAAALVQQRWDALHAAGHLDEPRLERDRPRVTWHVEPAVGLLALVAVAWAVAPR